MSIRKTAKIAIKAFFRINQSDKSIDFRAKTGGRFTDLREFRRRRKAQSRFGYKVFNRKTEVYFYEGQETLIPQIAVFHVSARLYGGGRRGLQR